MLKQAQFGELLKKEVRSLLIAAKGGLTPAQLEKDYLDLIGKPLPVHDLGFQSTMELAAAMSDVVRICTDEKGTFILKGIADETTKGLAELVARQRDGKAHKHGALKANAASASQKRQSFHQRYRTPKLTGTVKTKMEDLLNSWKCLEVEMKKEEVAQAAPADEMPPLELSFEMENCLLMAEEKLEPAEKQAPQDLELCLLKKLILTPEIPLDAVQDRSLCGLPPLERRCLVGVLMGFIVSPSQFYIHVLIRGTRDELLDMMIEMRHCYSDKCLADRYLMPESAVRPGQLCCGLMGSWWYRVIIHRVINDREVEVFCTDYGNLQIVQKSCLRFLKCCYSKLPAQAIPCSLAGVKPVEGTWSSAATLLFRKLGGSKPLVGLVDEYVNGVLHLFLCDTSGKEDVSFHHVLIEQGHADICNENIPSQGFMGLNPLAMYVQPHGQQENAELVEPDLCLQQESLCADSETGKAPLDGDSPLLKVEWRPFFCTLTAKKPKEQTLSF